MSAFAAALRPRATPVCAVATECASRRAVPGWRSEVHAVCRQLRTRDCVRCKFFLYVLTDPIVESSHSCEFGAWHISYPRLDKHFAAASLDPAEPNLFGKVYDFTGDVVLGGGAPHWTLAEPRKPRCIDLDGVDGAPINPLAPGAGDAAAGTAVAASGATLEAYTLVRPKRFAIKRSPPEVILECEVVEPVAAAGRHRLLIYRLDGLGASSDVAATAAALLDQMPRFSTSKHPAALPQLQRIVARLASQVQPDSGSASAADAPAPAGAAVEATLTTQPVLSREAKVKAIFGKFDPKNTGLLKFVDMNALVRATEGEQARLDLPTFEDLCSHLKANPKQGLSLQDLTNFFGLSEDDADLNDAYNKIFAVK